MRHLFAALMASAMFTSPAVAKCLDRDAACQIEMGEYHVLAPFGPVDDTRPAVMFLHGYGSHGGNTINNAALIEPMLARGYVVIAPSGLPRADGKGASWLFHGNPDQHRNEYEFLQQVLIDAHSRTPFDRAKVLLAGFSGGAFMVSNVACHAPNDFAAYAPLAGGFLRPHPDKCAGPVRVLQTHGWDDGTVPLEGRPLGEGVAQGDIFQTLQIWRAANDCDQMRADERTTGGPYWRRTWTHCAPGSALEFALHIGGHSLPDGWADMALDWFENLSLEPSEQL